MNYILKSLDIVRKNKIKLLLPIGIDIVGFIAASIIYSYFFLKLHPHLRELVEIVGPLLGKELASISSQGELTALAGSVMRLQNLFGDITKLLLWMAVSLFVVWLVSQIVSWYSVKKIVKKVKFWRYVRDFSIVSSITFVVFIAFVKIVFKASYFSEIVGGKIADPKNVSVIILIGMIILLYLMVVFYLNCGEKNMFRKSIRDLVKVRMVGIFVVSLLILAIIGWILYKLMFLLSLGTGESIALFAPVYLLMFPIIVVVKLFYHVIV